MEKKNLNKEQRQRGKKSRKENRDKGEKGVEKRTETRVKKE